MSKDKKQSKPRAEHYEPKVSLNVDFNQALNILAQNANKVVKDRSKESKSNKSKG